MYLFIGALYLTAIAIKSSLITPGLSGEKKWSEPSKCLSQIAARHPDSKLNGSNMQASTTTIQQYGQQIT